MDGLSLYFFKELAEEYKKDHNTEKIQLQVGTRDFRKAAQAELDSLVNGNIKESLDYWKLQHHVIADNLKLPTDYIRKSSIEQEGSSIEFVLNNDISQQIRELSSKKNISVYTIFMALYSALLYRYTEQSEINIGVPVLNRHNLEDMSVIGCFVNTLALHFEFSQEINFRNILEMTSIKLNEALLHQRVPFPLLVKELNIKTDPSVNPLFQTMLTWLGKDSIIDFGEGLSTKDIHIKRRHVKFDLLVNIREQHSGQFILDIEYNCAVFKNSTINRIFNHFETLSASILSDVDAPINHAELLSVNERQEILAWNATKKTYPKTNVLEMIISIMKERSSSVALEFGNSTLTYGRLNSLTSDIAQWLFAKTKSEFIGVIMERSFDMTIALLAIMRSGKAWVPIDPEYPQDRIDYMIQDSGVELILTQDKFFGKLKNFRGEAITLEKALNDVPDSDSSGPSINLTPDSRAYMIYTSGSTGKPKGVINTHKGMFNRLYWMQEQYRLTPKDRVLQKTPFSFDVSVWEFFWPLMFGARIVIATPGGHRDTTYLKDLIADKRITILHFVPSMLNAFLKEDDLSIKCSSLINVFCSGEALSAEIIKSFYSQLSCSLHNLYGPTEAAIDVSFWKCDKNYSGNVVPIGKPIANTQLFVLNKALRMQPVGIAGELFISGVQLAEGYNNKPELTDKAFIDVRSEDGKHTRMYKTGDLARYNSSGNIEYIGRVDHQIKLRGFRIELGEIEAVILTVNKVREAAVILDESTGIKRLVAYLSLNASSKNSNEQYEISKIKTEISQKLPGFMVPSHFVFMETLPLSANGKLDRRALPVPLAHHTEPKEIEFNSEKEALFHRIISKLIPSSSFNLGDNFFNIGGDSILALRLISELKKNALTLTLRDIYEARNISEMVLMASDLNFHRVKKMEPYYLIDSADKAVVSNKGIDAWPMSVLQKGMVYHSLLHEESSVYHDIFSYEIDDASVSELTTRIERAFKRNEQLQCVFDMTTCSVPIQICLAEPVKDITRIQVIGDLNDHLVHWEYKRKQVPFDFESGPLVRFTLHTVDESVKALSLDFHHAVLDGWSVATLINEIVNGTVVEPQSEVENLNNGYATFVAAESEAVNCRDSEAYWMNTIQQETCKGFGLDVDVHTSKSESIILSDDFVLTLRELSRKHSVPLKTVALYFHCLTLRTVSGQKNICFGHVVNGRLEYEGAEKSLGLYLNTVPFIVKESSISESDLLNDIFNTEKFSLDHRRFPLANMLKAANRDNVFDVVFNFTDFHAYALEKNFIRRARYYEQTNFPVMLHFARDPFTGGYSVTLNYHDTVKNSTFVKDYISSFNQLQIPERGLPVPEDLVTIFHNVTKNHFGIDDNYHSRGVDSISALRIAALLKKAGYYAKLRNIVESTSLTEFWASIQNKMEEQTDAEIPQFTFDIPAALKEDQTAEDYYPLTDTQLLMIEAYHEEANFSTYHDIFGYELSLRCVPEYIENVLEGLIAAHPVLRTSFVINEGTIPLQKVHKKSFLNHQNSDFSQSDKLNAYHKYLRWFEAEKEKPFDFSKQELVRFYSHKIGEERFYLTISFHHSILDGFSLSQLIRSFVTDYQNLLNKKPILREELPIPTFREYCLLSKAESLSHEAKAFWKEVLFEEPILKLPFTFSESGRKWSETKITFESDLSLGLADVAQKSGVSLKHLLQAVHFTVLKTLFNTPELISSMFSGGRTDCLHSEKTLGMFLNFLPVRCNLSDLTITEAAHQLRDFENRSLPYKRFSLSEINSLSRHKSYLTTCFNFTRFSNYQAISNPQTSGNDGSPLVRTLWFEHTHFGLLVNAGFDLSLNEIVITLNAKSKVISEFELEQLAQMYMNTARAAVSIHNLESITIHSPNVDISSAREIGKAYEAN
ncbi:amino acid adenylation domain-containing protein [Xenorhabdus cabanillasii]|uniref:Amino acid adenylation domain-containing protein n=1 Tax=Xenorhabdus cabanillasii TaxID=351673 RepID=A0A3D9UIG1_9GAMM|nr:non-ribosomal peptide synthetase [Xenorhabdus cabanillasii]REF26405.1 amino acid adenylation domain-containing protein [Xenorhabdus cabanillasii]